MRVLHVNRALPEIVVINGREVLTGIYKKPVEGPVAVRKLGIDGDGQADLTVHGGIHQAVYGYPSEHYAFWEAELDRPPFPPGMFGENLTLEGMLESDVHLGDVYRIGTCLLQVTAPRLPCFKFGHKINHPAILKPFLHSGRSGFYFSVLEEGVIAAGNSVELVTRDAGQVSIRTLLGMQRLGEGNRELLGTALSSKALAPPARADLESRLAKR